MKLSVVTISFNQAEFLERTILSVVNQEGVEIEYIMVDAGSTDGSRDIIAKYRDKIAHVIEEKDDGAADGLNKGFALATGDVYCYLNSDDTFETGALSLAAAELYRRPEADVICGHGWAIDPDDKKLRKIWSEPFRPLMVAYGAAVQIQPSTFIRREAFLKSGGFNVSNRSNWDGELLLDLYQSGAKIEIFDGFVSNYRLHEVSITNSGQLDARIAEWGQRQFEKLRKRPRKPMDATVGKMLRIFKHIRHPVITLERIRKGPLYKRGIK